MFCEIEGVKAEKDLMGRVMELEPLKMRNYALLNNKNDDIRSSMIMRKV
jgi:hypothetical protein